MLKGDLDYAFRTVHTLVNEGDDLYNDLNRFLDLANKLEGEVETALISNNQYGTEYMDNIINLNNFGENYTNTILGRGCEDSAKILEIEKKIFRLMRCDLTPDKC